MAVPVASPRVRALSAALKQARLDAGLGQRELARMLGIQHAKLSYWENGSRVPDVADVSAILAKLDVTGANRDRILELTRNAREPNWLTAGMPGVSPGLAGVLDCERTATAITDWSPLLIPGLLQTSDYARAVLSSGDLAAHEVEARVMMRLARRDVIDRSEPVTLTALIGESALREVIGGPALMADQLRHLLMMADKPTVSVRIMPHGLGWHPGLSGPFILFEFADSPSIVHIEHHRSSAFIYDEKDVQDYQSAAKKMNSMAMTPGESLGFIAEELRQLESAA
ncbi:helix-turn-helix domain-containing protein [Saccharomonospora azurea]